MRWITKIQPPKSIEIAFVVLAKTNTLRPVKNEGKKMSKFVLSAATVSLCLSVAPAYALGLDLDVSLGGGDGKSVSANLGDTNVSVSLGGGGGNIADVDANVGDVASVEASVGSSIDVDASVGSSVTASVDVGGGTGVDADVSIGHGGSSSHSGSNSGGTDMASNGNGNGNGSNTGSSTTNSGTLGRSDQNSGGQPQLASANRRSNDAMPPATTTLNVIGGTVWTSDRVLVGIITGVGAASGNQVLLDVEVVDSLGVRHNVVKFQVAPHLIRNNQYTLGLSRAALVAQLT